MNIDSKKWSVRSYNDGYAHITQRSTGTIRTVSVGSLPSHHSLALMSEARFDAIMREAFHA